MAQATIVAEKVFGPRTIETKNGPGEVYDVRTSDGQKYGVWGNLGATIKGLEGQELKIEYTEFEKGGYVNKTIKSISAANGGTPTATVTKPAADIRGQQINRSVAFKGAVDLVVAFGSADSPFDALAQVGALTEDALLIVDASFVAESFSLADTE